MNFDFSASSNAAVFRQLLETVGPKRVLFGSDLPILRMRARRVCEKGFYVNIVPKGLYGNVAVDPHMREVAGAEAEKITFFMYEELAAFDAPRTPSACVRLISMMSSQQSPAHAEKSRIRQSGAGEINRQDC